MAMADKMFNVIQYIDESDDECTDILNCNEKSKRDCDTSLIVNPSVEIDNVQSMDNSRKKSINLIQATDSMNIINDLTKETTQRIVYMDKQTKKLAINKFGESNFDVKPNNNELDAMQPSTSKLGENKVDKRKIVACRISLLCGAQYHCEIDRKEKYEDLCSEVKNYFVGQKKFKQYYNENKLYINNNKNRMSKLIKGNVVVKSCENSLQTIMDNNTMLYFYINRELPLKFYVGCSPTILIWNPTEKKEGYVSLILSDWTYISFRPEISPLELEKQNNLDIGNTDIENDGREDTYVSACIEDHLLKWYKHKKINTLKYDIKAERREPDKTFPILKLNETSIKKWWNYYLKTEFYNVSNNNCGHAVIKALIVGNVCISDCLKGWLGEHNVNENIQFIIDQTENNSNYRNGEFITIFENCLENSIKSNNKASKIETEQKILLTDKHTEELFISSCSKITNNSKAEDLIPCLIHLLDGKLFKCKINKYDKINSNLLENIKKYFRPLDEHYRDLYINYHDFSIMYVIDKNGVKIIIPQAILLKKLLKTKTDMPMNFKIGCKPTIFVWKPSIIRGKVGHASLLLSDGTYISFWPNKPSINALLIKNKPKKSHSLDEIGSDPDMNHKSLLSLNKSNKINTLRGDIEAEGRNPSMKKTLYFFKLFEMDEKAIKEWWPMYLQTEFYNFVSNNCANAVMKALILAKVWINDDHLKHWIKTPGSVSKNLLSLIFGKMLINDINLKGWIRTPYSVGKKVRSIIEQTVGNEQYREQVFIKHYLKCLFEHPSSDEDEESMYCSDDEIIRLESLRSTKRGYYKKKYEHKVPYLCYVYDLQKKFDDCI